MRNKLDLVVVLLMVPNWDPVGSVIVINTYLYWISPSEITFEVRNETFETCHSLALIGR